MIRNKNSYLTSAEAAKLLGFSPDYIRLLIIKGKIKAEKLGHNWLIKPKDLSHVKRQRFSRDQQKDE